MKLSDNERMVLSAFNQDDRPFSNFNDGIAVDSSTYASDLVDDIASLLEVEAKSAKGMLSSMLRKGIFTSEETAIDDEGHERDKIVKLTDAGVEMISDLRLEDEEAMLEVDIEPDIEVDGDPEEEPEDELAHTREAANARIKKARKKDTEDLKEAAAEDIKEGKPSLRTSHANCKHATQGKEGKIARAKCRRDRAAAAAKASEKATKKADKKEKVNA